MRRIAALLAVSAGLGVALPAAPASARPAEVTMVQNHQQDQTCVRASGLRPAYSLFVSAKLYSHRMMRSDYFGHMSRIPVASPLAGGRGDDSNGTRAGACRRARPCGGGWHSPPHRAVLLSSRFTRIGVGRARGRYGRTMATMWVAHVGRR